MTRCIPLALLVLLSACEKSQPASRPSAMPSHVTQSDKAKDPVCGMEVNKTKAKHAAFDNADVYFCSDECLKKFNAEPTKYLKPCACAQSTPPCGCSHCGRKCVPCACPPK